MNKGFTLIEAILYLAIAGTVLYFISGFAFNIIFSKSKIEAVQEVSQNNRSVLDEISQTISDAEGINGVNIDE
jgi:Tfp pilus assembly protein PilE